MTEHLVGMEEGQFNLEIMPPFESQNGISKEKKG